MGTETIMILLYIGRMYIVDQGPDGLWGGI